MPLWPQAVMAGFLVSHLILHVTLRGDKRPRELYNPYHAGFRVVWFGAVLYFGGFWNALSL